MKIIENTRENGLIVGNFYNKYDSSNPVTRILLKNFEGSLFKLLSVIKPLTIHEIGCGEGYWTTRLKKSGYNITGSDISEKAIKAARENACALGIEEEIFSVENIEKEEQERETPELYLALEVFEHLAEPEKALTKIKQSGAKWLLCSVPNEPLWSFLNICRGKYLGDFGNTPGHVQKWSSKSFTKFLENYSSIISVKKPVPWTMALCELNK